MKGVIIEVNPQLRVPRTYKRFAGLMGMLISLVSVRKQNLRCQRMLDDMFSTIIAHVKNSLHRRKTNTP